jgi:hypothetical protein
MAKQSTIEKLLEQQHGNLHEVIPNLANEHGQEGAAEKLNVNQSWVSWWLRRNGYQRRETVQWVRTDQLREMA